MHFVHIDISSGLHRTILNSSCHCKGMWYCNALWTENTARNTSKDIIQEFPHTTATTVVIGDSQTKYPHQNFDLLCTGSPAFISRPGTCIADPHLLVHYPFYCYHCLSACKQ